MIWLGLVILVIVGICIVIYFFRSRKKENTIIYSSTKPQSPTIDQTDHTQQQNTEETINTPNLKQPHKTPIQKTTVTTTYPLPSIQKGFPVKHNYKKEYQESIVTLIPEDSIAFSLLFEAYELEINGGSKLEIENILSDARKIANKDVDTYLARLATFKQHHNPKIPNH